MPWVPVEEEEEDNKHPYQDAIDSASSKHEVHPAIIAGIIQHESSGNPKAVSPTGPQGLMQLGKAAAMESGIDPSQRFDPTANIEAGTSYYKRMLDQFGPKLAYAAYHDGPGAVQEYLQGKRQLSPEALRGTDKFGKMHAQATGHWAPVEDDLTQQQPSQQPGSTGQDWEGSTGFMKQFSGQSPTPQTPVGGSNPLAGLLVGAGNEAIDSAAALASIAGKNDLSKGIASYHQASNAPGQSAGAMITDIAKYAPTSLVGGIPLRALASGAIGYGTTEGGTYQRGTQGILDATLSGAGDLLGKFIGNKLKLKADPGAQQLLDAGVELTPGQRVGPGILKTMEDQASSIPFVGGVVNARRADSLTSFNKSEINKALKPIGKSLNTKTNAGYSAIEEANKLVSDYYTDALSGKTLTFEPDHVKANILGMASDLPNSYQTKLSGILDTFIPSGQKVDVGGEEYKQMLSNISHYTRKFGSSNDPLDQMLGDVLSNVNHDLNISAIWNSGPNIRNGIGTQTVAKILKADEAYAKMLNVNKAATQLVSAKEGGVFTPNALYNANKAGIGESLPTTSANRFVSSGGLDELANATRILPSSVPDSGTAGRSLLAAALTGHLVNPLLGSVMGAGTLLGTKQGLNKFVNPLLFNSKEPFITDILRPAALGLSDYANGKNK